MTGTRFSRHTLAGAALALLMASAPPARASFLTYIETIKPGVGGVTGITDPYGAAVSPDGKHVYIAGNADNALVTFGRDPATGALTWLGAQQNRVNGVDGLEGPHEVLVSPDGRHVYVASDNGLAVFARDAATGELTYVQNRKHGVGGIQGLGLPFGLAISPDGASLYAVGRDSFSVTVFARDASSGALALVEEKFQGIGGVDGIQQPQRIAISPDGAHVYVAGAQSNSIAVFSRNPATGKLAFVEKQQDGVNGVEGLGSVMAAAVSGDGKHVYACGFDGAVVVFARNAPTGALTFVEFEHEAVNGVTGIVFCGSLVVSPDGQHVYATGSIDDALAVFDRDPATGALAFVEADVRKPDLYAVNTVVQSPDGMNLYAIAGDAVTVFRLTAALATTTSTTSTSTTSTVVPPTTATTSPGNSTTTTTSPGSSSTTTTLLGCGPSPQAGCKHPRASRLRLHAGATSAGNRLAWLWTRGAGTTLADFGDPRTDTDYRLCVYDNAATTPTLVLEAPVPAAGACNGKPCWRSHRGGYRFKSRDAAGDGISRIDLAPGREGKAAIVVQGHGANLPFPSLPLTLSVKVQLRASNGSCWEASAKVVGKGASR